MPIVHNKISLVQFLMFFSVYKFSLKIGLFLFYKLHMGLFSRNYCTQAILFGNFQPCNFKIFIIHYCLRIWQVSDVLIKWAPIPALSNTLLTSCQFSFPNVCSFFNNISTFIGACLIMGVSLSIKTCAASLRLHIWRKPNFLRCSFMNPSCFHVSFFFWLFEVLSMSTSYSF